MRTIGILGGMGSYATCEIFRRLLNAFPAEKEWDRLRILIDNNCVMPSRVRAILYGERKDQLVNEMSDSVRHLVATGAELILLGCMTAHYFRPNLPHQDKIIDALAETHQRMTERCRPGAEISCLCTEGSVQTGIWEKALPEYVVRYPDEAGMKQLRGFIEAVKQNQVTPQIKYDFLHFMDNQPGCCILLGCTELPLLLDGIRPEKEWIDPIECAIEYLKKESQT